MCFLCIIPIGAVIFGKSHKNGLVLAGREDWRKFSSERMDSMVECLPVAHMVEALLTLLGQDSPAPPPWFKSEAGKLLSRLIMREGGVAAAIGRLVGGTQGVSNST